MTDKAITCGNCSNWKRHHPRDAGGYCSFWETDFAFEDETCWEFKSKERENG